MTKILSEVSRDAAEEAWDREIKKRVAELRSGQVKTVPLDEVHQKIESYLRKQTFSFNS
jgi:hypothetical protein